METQTTPSTLTENKISHQTADGIKTIKTIFDWEANWLEHWDEGKRHSHSHCLLRIYVDVKANRAAVIASELNSNRQNIDIGHDFEGLARAVVREFRAILSIPLTQITWIQHYGRFSEPRSYENLGTPDEFSKIDLPWKGKELKGKGKETVLDEEVENLLGWTNLQPVEQVLTELGRN